jgi:hypothetical protein
LPLSCCSQNKQWLFLYAALTHLFLITEMETVYCAVLTEYWNIIHVTRHVSNLYESNLISCFCYAQI